MVLYPPTQKGDSRGAEFPARMGDVLADDFMRDAEMIGDGFVRMAVRQLATYLALARREAAFVSGGGLRSLEGSCQKRGNDAALAIRLLSGGEKRDKARFFHAACARQRKDDGVVCQGRGSILLPSRGAGCSPSFGVATCLFGVLEVYSGQAEAKR